MTLDELVAIADDHTLPIGNERRLVIREAASQILAMKGALEEQTIMVDRLCSAVDRETEGIGGEGSLTVLRLLGPINDNAIALLGGRSAISPTKSAADKIAEGLRDAIAIAKAHPNPSEKE
jgi:hypothetical protein